MFIQVARIDLKRTREEQKPEHPVQEVLGELEARDDMSEVSGDFEVKMVEKQDTDRNKKGNESEADRFGELKEAMINITCCCGYEKQDCRDFFLSKHEISLGDLKQRLYAEGL